MIYTTKLNATMTTLSKEYSAAIEDTQAHMTAADSIADPAERYLHLADTTTKLQKLHDTINKNIRSHVFDHGTTIGLLQFAAAAIALPVSIFFVGLPVFFGLGAACLAMFVVTDKVTEHMKERSIDMLHENATPARAFVETASFDVFAKKVKLLKEELPKIATSPHLDALYDRCPEVKDAFIKASARKTAATAAAPTPPEFKMAA